MSLSLHHEAGAVTGFFGERLLFRYVYLPDVQPVESPKPHFHPLNTLNGATVTDFRPADHPWHSGLAMTCAHLSGFNFWGGRTYVRGEGYVQLDNNGRVVHEAWLPHEEPDTVLLERLAWLTPAGESLIDERRTITPWCLPERDAWGLTLFFVLHNISGRVLEFGSPTTQGRPNAGYGGLFWRGAPPLLEGTILAAGGLAGPEIMGQRAAWLAYLGGQDYPVSLVFLDAPDNPRHPTPWFVRHQEYPGVCCAFMFSEVYLLPPGESLALRYRIAIGDGRWSRAQIENWVSEAQRSG